MWKPSEKKKSWRVFCPQSSRFNLTNRARRKKMRSSKLKKKEKKKTKQKLESNRATRCSCAIRSGDANNNKRWRRKNSVAVAQHVQGREPPSNMTRLWGNSRTASSSSSSSPSCIYFSSDMIQSLHLCALCLCVHKTNTTTIGSCQRPISSPQHFLCEMFF